MPKHPLRLGVVSAVAGELLVVQGDVDIHGRVGREVLPIADWGVDRAYERQMADALLTLPGVAAALPLPNPAEFAEVNQGFVPVWGKVSHGALNWYGIRNAVRTHWADASLDGIVIAVQGNASGLQFARGHALLGAGAWSSTRDGVSKVHVIARLALISCRTAAPVAIGWLSRDKPDWVTAPSQGLPLEDLPAGRFDTSMVNWPAERFGELRSRLADLPAPAWRLALDSLLRS
jgi:hypothetical protein